MGIQNPQLIKLSLYKRSDEVLDGAFVPIPAELQYPVGYFAPTVMPFEVVRPAPANQVVGFYSPDYYGYVGRETQIRVTAQGGAYPYAVVIDEAPTGATISNNPADKENYLVLKFTPTANGNQRINLRLYDQEGKMRRISYMFTTSTDWCVFVSSNGDDTTGTGTKVNPWQTVDKAFSTATGGKCLILENGTYSPTLGRSLSSSSINSIVAWQQGGAVIDYSSNVQSSPSTAFYINSSHTLIQGMVFNNPPTGVTDPRFFSASGSTSYVYQDNCDFNINGRVGTQNFDNISCFFFGDAVRSRLAQTRCNFTGFAGTPNGWSSFDFYNVSYFVVECNTYGDQRSTTTGAGMLWPKGSGCRYGDIKNNEFIDVMGGSLIDVYMANTPGVDNITGAIDVSFNLIRAVGTAGIWIARSSQSGIRLPVWTRRNTVIGGAVFIYRRSHSVTFSSDSDVIQSTISSTDPFKVVVIDQNDPLNVYRPLSWMPLLSASVTNYECHANTDVVDSNGILVGSYAQYRGRRGHEIVKP